jgi:transcriptional regulator of met regulon
VLVEVSGRVSDQVAREAAAKARAVPVDPERLKDRIAQCVEARNVEQLIDAFAAYCEVPCQTVEDLVQEQSDEGLFVLGKASNMAWPELEGVLRVLLPSKTKTAEGMQALFANYVKLTAANAHRAVRFIRASAARMPGDTKKYA